MAKKKQLIDERTLANFIDADETAALNMESTLLELAKQAKKTGAACVNASFRFDGDIGVGNGEFIPELMLRVRKP